MHKTTALLAALCLIPAAPAFSAGPFTEADFKWDPLTTFYKDIIIKGVNKMALENPKCAVIDPASTAIAVGRGNPDDPVFVVLCGEAEHVSKVYFSKSEVL